MSRTTDIMEHGLVYILGTDLGSLNTAICTRYKAPTTSIKEPREYKALSFKIFTKVLHITIFRKTQ